VGVSVVLDLVLSWVVHDTGTVDEIAVEEAGKVTTVSEDGKHVTTDAGTVGMTGTFTGSVGNLTDKGTVVGVVGRLSGGVGDMVGEIIVVGMVGLHRSGSGIMTDEGTVKGTVGAGAVEDSVPHSS
jgi:hypothetical protein